METFLLRPSNMFALNAFVTKACSFGGFQMDIQNTLQGYIPHVVVYNHSSFTQTATQLVS